MSEWALKRFWTEAKPAVTDLGYAIELDGRRVKTPAKAALIVPTPALAEVIAAEWNAQDGTVDPTSMPATRLANAAIDRVAQAHAEVAEMIAAYGDSDLTCYRAEHPQGLVQRQAEAWDPALDWAADRYGARLEPRTGLMHAPQDSAALAVLAAEVHAMDNFHLAAFHDLVSLSGSLILGLAAAHDWRPAEEIWALSRIDESWQEQQWGEDEEATRLAGLKHADFLNAKRHWNLCAGSDSSSGKT